MNLQNTDIHGEAIEIFDSKTFNAIGHAVVLEDCIIRCRVPAKSLSIRGKIINSLVIVDRDLTGFSWLEAGLVGCTFKGVFKENEFGTLKGSNGCCEACVFTEADLDDCTFYGESCSSHTFPKWPHFVILYPRRHFAAMQNSRKCDRIADVVESIGFVDEKASAITYNSRSLAKRSGATMDDLREFFSQFSFVQI